MVRFWICSSVLKNLCGSSNFRRCVSLMSVVYSVKPKIDCCRVLVLRFAGVCFVVCSGEE